MRVRILSDYTNTATFPHWWSRDGAFLYNEDIPYDCLKVHREIRDVVIKDFKRKSQQGRVYVNPLVDYSCQDTSITTVIHGRGDYPGGGIHVEESVRGENPAAYLALPYPSLIEYGLSSDDPFSLFFSDKSSLAVTSAWENIDESEIQALASLAEMPETVRWIQHLLYRAITLCRAFRKTLKKLNFRDVPNAWLEFRYAFRPLVYEMDQARRALAKKYGDRLRSTARGFSQWEDTQISSVSGTWANYQRTLNLHAEWRAGVLYSIDQEINGLASVWGLDQPIESLWELVPFSFIVDWFFNVGDVISSWTGNVGLHPLGSWVTCKYIATERLSYSYTLPRTDWYFNISGPSATVQGSASRSIALKIRVPNPDRQVMPSINLNLDLGKILDLASIGYNIFRSLAK